MNIIEAIKKNKPIKRTGKSTWKCKGIDLVYYANTLEDKAFIDPVIFLRCVSLEVADIIAEDWETQPGTKTICSNDLIRPSKALGKKFGLNPETILQTLKNELDL